MSTTQNLQFLETQIDQYLHEHTVDDSNVLWVTNKGFRLPHAKTRENLERNMKYIERQLEEYLHKHEVDSTVAQINLLASENAGFEDGNIIDTDYNETPDDVTAGQWYHGRNSGQGILTIPTGGAAEGTRFARYTHSGSHLNNFSRYHYLIDLGRTIGPDVSNTFSIQVRGEFANGEFHGDQYDSSMNFLQQLSFNDPGLAASYADWTTLPSSGPVNEDTRYIFLQLTVVTTNGLSADIDDIELKLTSVTEETHSLQITPSGFRFPYRWEQTGALENNVKFLETQISKYLHSHIVGFE